MACCGTKMEIVMRVYLKTHLSGEAVQWSMKMGQCTEESGKTISIMVMVNSIQPKLI